MGSGINKKKIGEDQGSLRRDLGSQAVGSGSKVLLGDQGSVFLAWQQRPQNSEKRLNWRDLPTFLKFSCIFAVTFRSGTKLNAIQSAGLA